jgi:citrate synthase
VTLLDILYQAHHESALRGNCSHAAVVLAAQGSGDYFKSIAAGLLTLGGLHAPLMATYDLLESPDYLLRVSAALARHQRVPGWGNGFVKDGPDLIWTDCAEAVANQAPALYERILSITDALHYAGKRIYPNPSCYTAAVALYLGIPRYAVGELLIRGRLKAWTNEYGRVCQEAPCLA